MDGCMYPDSTFKLVVLVVALIFLRLWCRLSSKRIIQFSTGSIFYRGCGWLDDELKEREQWANLFKFLFFLSFFPILFSPKKATVCTDFFIFY